MALIVLLSLDPATTAYLIIQVKNIYPMDCVIHPFNNSIFLWVFFVVVVVVFFVLRETKQIDSVNVMISYTRKSVHSVLVLLRVTLLISVSMKEIYDTFCLQILQNTGKMLIASCFMRLATFEKETLLILCSCFNSRGFVFWKEFMEWRLSVRKMIL